MSKKHVRRGGARGTVGGQTTGGTTAQAPLLPDARVVKVAFGFVVIYAVMQTAVWSLAYRGYFESVLEATAQLTGACSSLTGVPASVTGNEVLLATRILRIDMECTGISLMMLYSALVLAYPIDVKRKVVGLVVGLLGIALANLIRLIAVAQLSAPLQDGAFLFIHDYLFKVVMVAVVVVLWGVYLASARRHAT